MEKLQHLAGKIEELKDKLSDGEYKDLLELAKQCYDEKEEKKKKKFVKCLSGSFKLIINVEDECDHSFFFNEGDKFNFNRDSDDSGDLMININKNVIFQEKILEVKPNTVTRGPPSICGDTWMNERHYELLKKDKYQADDDSIVVYLHDVEL